MELGHKMKKEMVGVHEVDTTGVSREVVVRDRRTLDDLIARKKLYPTHEAAHMFGLTVRYVRLLCRSRKVNAERILGRYYFTPQQIADLQQPIRASAHG